MAGLRLDRTTAAVLAYRCWQVLSGGVAVVLVVARLSASEQGFYYTFQNIPALQVVAELGLTFVVTQFASHEFAHLYLADDGSLQGEPRAKARLGSLLRSSIAWFVRAAFITLFVALAAGAFIFSRKGARATGVSWHTSFFLLVVTNAALLSIAPLFAILDGVGKVRETSQVRLCMDVVAGIGLWTSLVLGAGLHSLWVYAGLRLVIGGIWFGFPRRHMFVELARFHFESVKIDWRMEVWPFHWRMALSSLSGFFMGQTLNPIIFSVMGPADAGRFGLTLSLTTAIHTVALSFVYARAPSFGTLVASGKADELRRTWRSATLKSLFIAVLGYCSLMTGVASLRYLRPDLGTRILPLSCLAFMCLAQIANLVGTAAALYMRAHKTEPMMGVSLCMAVAIPLAGFLGARAGSLLGLTIAYALTMCIFMGALPWIILARFRRKLDGADAGTPHAPRI